MRFLKLLRALLGVSQRDLATQIGISVRELSRIEAGAAVPSRGTFLDIDSAFAKIVKRRTKKGVS